MFPYCHLIQNLTLAVRHDTLCFILKMYSEVMMWIYLVMMIFRSEWTRNSQILVFLFNFVCVCVYVCLRRIFKVLNSQILTIIISYFSYKTIPFYLDPIPKSVSPSPSLNNWLHLFILDSIFKLLL